MIDVRNNPAHVDAGLFRFLAAYRMVLKMRFLLFLALTAVSCRPAAKPSQQTEQPTNSKTAIRHSTLTPPASAQDTGHLAPATLPVALELRSSDWFDDVTGRSGIRFSYQNGRAGEKYTLLESVGGGVALLDYDGDGDLDVFLTGGGTISGTPATTAGLKAALYRNDGNWKFVDVTDSSGLGVATDYSIGCSCSDFDRDGHLDLLITGYPQTHLWRNLGNGTFEDVTAKVGLDLNGLHTASAWGDIDNDGWPDLFVGGYVKFDLAEGRQCGNLERKIRDICGIWQYPAAPDRLLRNRQGTSFEDISQRAEIRADGKALGVVASDLNADGHLDFYVANDYTPNHLYLGNGGGSFRETALQSGVAFDDFGVPQGSMGVDVGDYDGDGRGDIFITNYQMEDNTLYRNLGDAQFSVANSIGLQDVCRPYVGFGTGWVDFDSDGWLDLFVVNGHVMYFTGQSAYRQPSFLFRNRLGNHFENVSADGGPYFSDMHVARGAAVGDLDDDGAPDLVIIHHNAPVAVLRNQHRPPHWTSLLLKGVRSDPMAVGATVTVEFQGRKLVRHVRSGAGYLSQFDRRILVPTADDNPIKCEVCWLGGQREIFGNLAPRRTNVVVEGAGEQVSR
jgi:hypothetical protein